MKPNQFDTKSLELATIKPENSESKEEIDHISVFNGSEFILLKDFIPKISSSLKEIRERYTRVYGGILTNRKYFTSELFRFLLTQRVLWSSKTCWLLRVNKDGRQILSLIDDAKINDDESYILVVFEARKQGSNQGIDWKMMHPRYEYDDDDNIYSFKSAVCVFNIQGQSSFLSDQIKEDISHFKLEEHNANENSMLTKGRELVSFLCNKYFNVLIDIENNACLEFKEKVCVPRGKNVNGIKSTTKTKELISASPHKSTKTTIYQNLKQEESLQSEEKLSNCQESALETNQNLEKINKHNIKRKSEWRNASSSSEEKKACHKDKKIKTNNFTESDLNQSISNITSPKCISSQSEFTEEDLNKKEHKNRRQQEKGKKKSLMPKSSNHKYKQESPICVKKFNNTKIAEKKEMPSSYLDIEQLKRISSRTEKTKAELNEVCLTFTQCNLDLIQQFDQQSCEKALLCFSIFNSSLYREKAYVMASTSPEKVATHGPVSNDNNINENKELQAETLQKIAKLDEEFQTQKKLSSLRNEKDNTEDYYPFLESLKEMTDLSRELSKMVSNNDQEGKKKIFKTLYNRFNQLHQKMNNYDEDGNIMKKNQEETVKLDY